jgi:hypothetical protein
MNILGQCSGARSFNVVRVGTHCQDSFWDEVSCHVSFPYWMMRDLFNLLGVTQMPETQVVSPSE